jgi:hypothetical protein
VQPKAHQNKFANLNKTVLTDPLKMIAFFEQCQATNKATGILEKKEMFQHPVVHSSQATVTTTIEATNATATIDNPTSSLR